MENSPNPPPRVATDEPAPSDNAPALIGVRVSEALTESLIEPALAAAGDRPSGREPRHDGWTAERIRNFLAALAQSGIVADAAKAVGMSRQSAYALRTRAAGRAFQLAWRAAILLARQRLADDLLARAVHGYAEIIVRGGKVWGERHRHDNRLGLAMLARFDRQAASDDGDNAAVRFVAAEFDQFLDIAVAQGDGAAEFVESRRALGFCGHEEERVLGRLGNYRRYGVGLPEEIDVTDLDPNAMDKWTDEQVERAERSGFLDQLEA